MYSLDEQVLQTIVKGETANISAIALFAGMSGLYLGIHPPLSQRITWFWVMTWDKPQKILKENGQVVYCSTV
jgi:hypothetical protein